MNINKVLKNAQQKIGIANILLLGKTGVGKSTLINAVFQGNMAEVGQGRPVTKETKEITKEGVPIALIDTRGLELGQYGLIMEELEKYVRHRANEPDPARHIHVAWLCIDESSRRVEVAESSFVNMLAQYMPVIAVITKAKEDVVHGTSFKSTVERLLPNVRNVVRVRAIPETLDDGHQLPISGLDQLVELTMEVIPDGQRNAFIAAQKVNIELKITRANLVVASATTVAGLTGAIPSSFTPPGGHATMLVTEQVAMFAVISLIFGLSFDEAFFSTFISGIVGGSAATIGGRELFRRLVEWIPGGGGVFASAVIGAGTASTITGIMGAAYIATLAKLIEDNPNPTPEEVVEAFKKELRESSIGGGVA